SDLYQYIRSTLDGYLESMDPFDWSPDHAVCVVMASKGYPGSFKTGLIIRGVDSRFDDNVTVFHAGTIRNFSNQLLTSSGRVLAITAKGSNLEKAAAYSYEAAKKISWGNNDEYYRQDIARNMD